jgi:uncharacterized protein DUF6527
VSVLKFIDGRPYHWCPACELLHPLPSDTGKWKFDGDLERPSFSPSFKQFLGGERVCHYVIAEGVIHFCADSAHAFAKQAVPMPPIPLDLDD